MVSGTKDKKPGAFRDVVRLGLVSLIYALGLSLVLFILPSMAYNVSSNIFVVGVLVAIPALTSMISAIPVGGLVEAFGRRNVAFLGLLIMAVLGLSLPYALSFTGLVLFVIFYGIACQMLYSSLKASLMDMTNPKKSSQHFGIIMTAFQSGFALGPLIGGYLILNGVAYGITSVSKFFMLDILAVAFLMIVFKFGASGSKVREKVDFKKTIASGVGDYIKLKHIGLIVLWLTVLFTSYDGLALALEPLFGNYYGFNAFTVGLILSMFILPFVLFDIPAGLIADRYGKFKVIMPSLMISGLFMVIFSMVKTPMLLGLCAFISTAGLAFAWTAMAGLLVDASSKFKKGGIVGVWNASEEIGYLLAPVIGGLIAQYSSINVPFMALGILMILTSFLVLPLGRKI